MARFGTLARARTRFVRGLGHEPELREDEATENILVMAKHADIAKDELSNVPQFLIHFCCQKVETGPAVEVKGKNEPARLHPFAVPAAAGRL